MSALSRQPARVPLVDPQTGLVTVPWYRFLEQLYVRAGGSSGPSTEELSLEMPEDSGVEELKAEFFQLRDQVTALPPRADYTPTDDPSARIEALEAQVSFLMSEIEAMKQGNTL